MKQLLFFILTLAISSLLFSSENYLYDVEIDGKDKALKTAFSKLDVWSFYKDENGKSHYRIFTTEEKISRLENFSVKIELLKYTPETFTPLSFEYNEGMKEYHDPASIVSFMEHLEESWSSLAKLYTIGQTGGGKDIVAIKISSNPEENAPGKTEVIYVGAHHAREWISVEVPLHLAAFILENYELNPRIKEIVDQSEIWIIPVLNVDGHSYSWESGVDEKDQIKRMWRKNRKMNWDGSFGVDPNRNYDSNWCEQGSSNKTTDDIYCGTAPFSENETQAIRNLAGDPLAEIEPLDNLTDDVAGLISYHSYSQLILYPFGGSYDVSEKAELMKSITYKMAALVKEQTGKNYTAMQSSELYLASGDTTDWFHVAHGGKTAFTIELRPGGNEMKNGFLLPARDIADTVKENIPAALYYLEYLIYQNYKIDTDGDGDDVVDYYDNCPSVENSDQKDSEC